MNSNEGQGKHVLFISELPDNINDTELNDFFKEYEKEILMIQIDRNQKMYDLFNMRKPKATIVFKTHEKAEEETHSIDYDSLRADLSQIKGIGESRLNEIMTVIDKHIGNNIDDKGG